MTNEIFAVWYLIGAALVFWMQAGFAMVEAGFTRAKNTGNILMKNLMDFCIGCCVFVPLGFGLLLGENALGGFIGMPNLSIFTNYSDFPWSDFVFNLVFCATTATIVSGAMAERTKFLSYCIYSAIISAVIYPIEAHWVWGGGFLAEMGFHDFAGSACIHMVGGISALIGAWMLGPRIGKFTKNSDGSIKVNAFPGHNLPIGCLGCFILWLGWYGFNGAACTSVPQLGSVFVTTTIAPSIATFVAMVFTWIKYGKPDVSMCLNASLAGLVAITAPCDTADAFGSIIIGAVAGLLVCFGVWFLDYVLRIDDPVGAVAVHMMNGIWGTIAVGLFSNPAVPDNDIAGLFYGGGFTQLKIQLIGIACIFAWTAVTITIAYAAIKATVGLRVTEEEEIKGLDSTEHGLPSAYAGFSIMDVANTFTMDVNDNTDLGAGVEVVSAVGGSVASAPVAGEASEAGTHVAAMDADTGMHKVVIICKLDKFDVLKRALNSIGVTGMTMTQVMGCGIQKGSGEKYRGADIDATLLPKVKVEVIVSKIPVQKIIDTATKVLYTGHIGDGKIFVYNVAEVVKVRTGERNFEALADVE